MSKAFQAAVGAWAKKSEGRLRAVIRTATENLLEEANKIGPSVANPSGGEGGKMPADTGFLAASLTLAIGSMPTGPSRGDPNGKYAWNNDVSLKLVGVQAGSTIYAGWTANYAVKMEHRYGFMRSAAQNWQKHVSDAVREVKADMR